MRGVRLSIAKSYVGGVTSVAYPDGDDSLNEALVQEVMRCLATNLNVTVGDVTMFLAAWEDPDHWCSDWAEKLGVGWEDVPAAVEALLAGAIEDA